MAAKIQSVRYRSRKESRGLVEVAICPYVFRRMTINIRSDQSGQGPQPSERVVVDAVADSRTVLIAADQSRILENSQVLGDRRLGQRKFSNNLAAHPGFPPRQHAENPHPRGVTEGLGQFGELFVSLRTFQSQQIGLRRRRRFRAAQRLRNGLFFDSHSSINDSSTGAGRQALVALAPPLSPRRDLG